MFNWFNDKKELQAVKTVTVEVCPYCSIALEKSPTRKQKCKSCGKSFVVRTHYVSKNKLVLTEDSAKKYDIEKDLYYRDKNFIDNLKSIIGLSDSDFDNQLDKTTVELTQRFGTAASMGDVGWSIANKAIIDFSKKNDMQGLSSLYWQMSYYLHNCGKNYLHISQARFEIELRRYKDSDFDKVEVLATGDSCDNCKDLNGKIFTIDEAIRDKILPCSKCCYDVSEKSGLGWCRCCYVVNFD